MNSIVYNEDCIAGMKRYKDKHFDLAIVDPPYGIKEDGLNNHSRSVKARATLYTPKNWDKEPMPTEYFCELLRVSKNQIVWGANHFISKIPYDSSCWLIWDKQNGENDFADCEMAWTSLDTAVRRFKFRWAGMLQGNMKDKEIRIHPTQKPIALYEWILHNYAKQGDLILDTHLGSGSSRIACHKYGFDFTGFELDKEYFDAQEKRYNDFVSQLNIFEK